ncbi:MAG: hypothetical protein JWO12_1226 [Frankiales bacterium]|nr:hypothetical protein [Frankiales bacterium]
MRKISTAIATVGLAATALAGLGSTPAAANPACPSYPPGSIYSLDISTPNNVHTAPPGQAISIAARAHRGSTNCGSHVIYFQYAKPNASFVTYRSRVTNGSGNTAISVTVPDKYDTFRWVWYPTPHTVVTSSQFRITRG